ncbi:MAG: GGDEF domain-containing protein [Candidatus Zixiibacteriota bacterium]
MFIPLLIYVIVVGATLGAALILPDLAVPIVTGCLAFAVLGGGVLIYMFQYKGTARLQEIVRLYMRYAERIYGDFNTRTALEKQVANLAEYLEEEIDIAVTAVYARRKRGFMLTDCYGIKKEELKAYKVLFRPELEDSMESRATIVSFRKVYPGTGGQGSEEHPFEYALPILTSARCNFFIAFSEPERLPFKLLRPFLLALADQIGNYKHLDDANYKHNLTVQKLKQQLDNLKRERDTLAARPVHDARFLITAQDRLSRIQDREKLYQTFIQLMTDQFKIDALVLLLPTEDRKSFVRKFSHGKLGSLAEDFQIDMSHPLLPEAAKSEMPLSLEGLPGELQSDEKVATLLASGVKCVGFMNGISNLDGYVGLSCRPAKFSKQEVEGFSSFCKSFGLVLENLSNFEKIERLSYTDEMTGLHNYRYFYKRLQEEMLRAQRFDRRLALAIFDVDGFKVFNDTYGHQSGDYLLEQLGALLIKSVRSIDIVSRYGGEEFCIIMPESDVADCVNFMERLRVIILNEEFKDKFSSESHRITVSLGGAIYPNDAQRIDRLIYCADMALLQAKGTGKNKSFMFDENLITVKK